MERYFEDFHVGDTFASGPVTVDPAEVHAFASAYDPQPFHLDAAAAERSVFRGLTTSGWHTAALGMRMLVASGVFAATGCVGVGVDELRWLKPVRPGDVLHLAFRIVEATPTSSGKRGTLRVATRVLDANGEAVMTHTAILLLAARPASAS
jgi:acyl dehydratase